MKRYLFNLIFSIVLMLVCAQAYSQVKLADSGVTKFYDNGTRITYFEMEDFPNSEVIREFVTKRVLGLPEVSRVIVYRDGVNFMYEALQDVEPDLILSVVNDAIIEYEKLKAIGDPEVAEKIEPASTKHTLIEVSEEEAPRQINVIPVDRAGVAKSRKSSSDDSNVNIKTK